MLGGRCLVLGGLGAERRVARGDGRLGGQAERPLLRRTTHLVGRHARCGGRAAAARRQGWAAGFAATCAADAAFLAQVGTWPEERLRAMQDCLGAHDQQLASVVRQRRNADKQWGAVVAREAERKHKRDEEHAAAALARAAALAYYAREKRRADRARAPPPPTRASHPTPAFVNRHLGHVGGKGVGLARFPSPPQNPRSPSGGGGGGGLVVVVETGGEMPVIPTMLDMAPVVLTYGEWHALEYPEGPGQSIASV